MNTGQIRILNATRTGMAFYAVVEVWMFGVLGFHKRSNWSSESNWTVLI
jgi:hypothetical protein